MRERLSVLADEVAERDKLIEALTAGRSTANDDDWPRQPADAQSVSVSLPESDSADRDVELQVSIEVLHAAILTLAAS